MGKTLRRLAACALALLVPATFAVQRTQTVPLGLAPAAAYADSVTGKLFIASEPQARTGAALTVIERSGRITSLPLGAAPAALAGDAASRRLVVALAGSVAAVVNLDSLKVTSVPFTGTALHVALSPRAGEAYVLARHAEGLALTAIDLKTSTTRTGVSKTLQPIAFAVDPANRRLYVLGTRNGAGVLQAFDAATLEPVADATSVGRNPVDVAIATAGDALAVLEHGDAAGGMRPVLRLLDPQLVTQRLLALPEGRFIETRGSAIEGEVLADPSRPRWWIRDESNARVILVNPASGAVHPTELESPPAALAVNPDKGTVLAVMPQRGQAALLSDGGARIDTVVIGHALTADATAAWPIAVDAGTGDTYVGHGVEGTITTLPRDEGPAGAVANLTDLWVQASEPGWGLFVEQQSTTAFAALFTYTGSGEATWLVMSNGVRQADGSFSGVLFRTEGPSRSPAAGVTPAGFMRLVPGADALTVTYVADGNSVTRKLQRFAFDASAVTACRWTATPETMTLAQANFTALWSNPTDPGWGVAISHRRQSLFAVLFTYDAQARPAWMVMSNGRQQATGQFSGDLYKVARGRVEGLGAMTLRFTAADEGTVTYRMDGTEFRAPLLKQRFAPLVSRCGG
jgi:hypothetical protein